MSLEDTTTALADAAKAAFVLAPDASLRLAFMADFVDGGVPYKGPSGPCRLIGSASGTSDLLDKILEMHTQMHKATLAAERAASAATKAIKDPRVALVAELRKQAEALGHSPVLTGQAPTHKIALALTQPDSQAALRAVFYAMDKDGNGVIDGKEWGKALRDPEVLGVLRQHFGQGATLAEVGAAFKSIDVDGSGSIDFDERTHR